MISSENTVLVSLNLRNNWKIITDFFLITNKRPILLQPRVMCILK